jgi:hypothetical protein
VKNQKVDFIFRLFFIVEFFSRKGAKAQRYTETYLINLKSNSSTMMNGLRRKNDAMKTDAGIKNEKLKSNV